MEYFYSWGLLFVIPFTIFVYLKSNKYELIKNILSGCGFGIFALIIGYIFTDYWSPVYLFNSIHLEDFLYGFLFAGILPSARNILTNNRINPKLHFNILLSFIYVILLLLIFYIAAKILKINHIYALSFTPFIIGIISLFKVKGNIKDVVITIFVSLFITILVYNIIIFIYPAVIENHFLFENVSGFKLLRVPLEEWIFAVGLAVGCTYTFEAVFDINMN